MQVHYLSFKFFYFFYLRIVGIGWIRYEIFFLKCLFPFNVNFFVWENWKKSFFTHATHRESQPDVFFFFLSDLYRHWCSRILHCDPLPLWIIHSSANDCPALFTLQKATMLDCFSCLIFKLTLRIGRVRHHRHHHHHHHITRLVVSARIRLKTSFAHRMTLVGSIRCGSTQSLV